MFRLEVKESIHSPKVKLTATEQTGKIVAIRFYNDDAEIYTIELENPTDPEHNFFVARREEFTFIAEG